MSGIVGIYYGDGRPVERADLERMVTSLAHRGPDGSGMWLQGAVGLGHCMLHTTLESLHEVAPAVDRAAELALTADARLDNREELIARLGLGGRPAGELSDSAIILAAYARWGEGCPEHLLGDFAFAIWDKRRQQLFCARDPLGVKPLYYYYRPGRIFVFASELKALWGLPGVPRTLNEVKVADYLLPVFYDQESTYYEGVVRLPPAHGLTVGRGGEVRRWRYWRLDPARELRLGSDAEYVEAFRALLSEAVRCRVRSAFPVGATLSGGVDSSAISCLAGRVLAGEGRPALHTFSAIFPSMVAEDPRIEEQPYIEAVLEKGEFVPHYVRADECYPLAELAGQTDEAWPALSLYMSRAIFRMAQEQGVRVVLSGFGGDEVVSYGYEYLEELARTGRWAAFAREAQALARRRRRGQATRYLQRHGLPYVTELARQGRWGAFARQVEAVAEQFAVSRWQLWREAGVRPVVLPLLRRVGQWGGRGAESLSLEGGGATGRSTRRLSGALVWPTACTGWRPRNLSLSITSGGAMRLSLQMALHSIWKDSLTRRRLGMGWSRAIPFSTAA